MDSDNRPGPLVALGLFLITGLSTALVVLATTRGIPGPLLLPAFAFMIAMLGGGLLAAIKARTGFLLSPLFTAPADVRKRVIDAMHGEQQPLADQDEQRLALVEAHRIRRLTPIFVPLMTLLFFFLAWGTYLRLTDDDPSLAPVVYNVVCTAFFAFHAVHHLFSHRRCGAYLDRFGKPRPQEGPFR